MMQLIVNQYYIYLAEEHNTIVCFLVDNRISMPFFIIVLILNINFINCYNFKDW